jgi:hypothetical protein
MKDINTKIAEYICLAQQASDAGKDRFIIFRNKDNKSLSTETTTIRRGRRDGCRNTTTAATSTETAEKNYAQSKGYDAKEEFILKIINLIRKNKTHFNYWVTKDSDQNGYPSYISYFDFKIEGKRFQVSFHTPKTIGKKLEKYVSTGRKTRWDRNPGGSVMACQKLIEYYNL